MSAEALPYDGRPRSSRKTKPTTFETLTLDAPWLPILRRMMRNELDEKIGQVTQRPSDPVVDPLSTSVGCDLGCQAGQ